MEIARFSVNRPVFTTMVTMIVLILGGISLSRLPVDLMPDITYPTLSIYTSYSNASPEEIEELITRPIEEAVSAVPGVEEVSSTSSEGSSSVRVTFSWGTDLDAAASDIRDRLDRVISRLPDEADRPALRKFDLASFPILILGASSRLNPVQLRRIIDEQLKYRIERVPGVAALDVWGGLDREIHVDLDPDRLKAMGISVDQLISRIKSANITLPAGSIEVGDKEITLRIPGEFTNLDQIRQTAVATRNDVIVRLKDVAEVADLWEKPSRIVRVNGEPGIRLSVNKQSGTNTVAVARQVLAEVARINEDIPQIRLMPITDSSEYIERSIRNMSTSAIYGGLFAVLVLLFFLRDGRSTAVISVAIPISMIATFTMVYFGGFTINLMSLGGLALGVGMLVDNAIVVLENIYRLRESGMDPVSASVKGAREVTAAVIASTMTTLAVFLPLVFVRGMAGVMFKQLAFVVSFSLLCSLVVALTLIPMLASRFLRPHEPLGTRRMSAGRWLYEITGGFFVWLENHYKALLHMALNHPVVVIFLSAALLGGSLFMTRLIGVELMPQSDEGEVRVNLEMAVGTRLAITDHAMNTVEKIVTENTPEIKSMVTSLGGAGTSHTGNMRISLVSMKERQRSSEDIAADLRRRLSGIPGTLIRTRAGQGLFIISRMTGGTERVEVVIRGYDLDTADALAQRVKEIVEQVPGVTDAQISRDTGVPEHRIVVDRLKAEAMKVTVQQVANVLQTVVSGTRAGYFREGGDEYAIRVRLKDVETRPLREILDLTLTNTENQPVVLRNIVKTEDLTGPVRIERRDQERIVTVRANIYGRDMGSIIMDAREALRALPVPKDFTISFGGDYEEQQKAFRELAMGFVLSLFLVYMVMACLYESLRDPFVIMFAVPLATIGVVLMLFFSETTFNMQSFIGCIMLGGIVVNNAILLVDTAKQIQERGQTLRAAVEEAGRLRLRPILMTSMTTICGLMPLAIGSGEGGEAQAPMARVVIGGLSSSILLTLVLVPVIFYLMERHSQARKRT